jgi:hypothetical protein
MLNILDIARYNELYPDAGIIPGDSTTTASLKVQRLFAPKAMSEADMRTDALEEKKAGTPYEKAIADIDADPAFVNKDQAKKIISEVYGNNKEAAKPLGKGILSKKNVTENLQKAAPIIANPKQAAINYTAPFIKSISDYLFNE